MLCYNLMQSFVCLVLQHYGNFMENWIACIYNLEISAKSNLKELYFEGSNNDV